MARDKQPPHPPRGATALLGDFFTVGLPDLAVTTGRVYFEITVLRLGDCQQVGWVPGGWAPESEEKKRAAETKARTRAARERAAAAHPSSSSKPPLKPPPPSPPSSDIMPATWSHRERASQGPLEG